MKLLLDKGAKIDACRKKVSTLMVACEIRCWPVVAFLLERGASLNIGKKRGSPRTLLQPDKLTNHFEAALQKNDREAMRSLVDITLHLMLNDKVDKNEAAKALAKMAGALRDDEQDLVIRIYEALGGYLEAFPEDLPVPAEIARYAAQFEASEKLANASAR